MRFVICQQKETERLALIQDDRINLKEWTPTERSIEADDWSEARYSIDKEGMFEDEPRGWYWI